MPIISSVSQFNPEPTLLFSDKHKLLKKELFPEPVSPSTINLESSLSF